MNSPVGYHVTEVFRVEAARFAGQILLSRMDEHVRFQIVFESEAFRAGAAVEGFFRSVHLQVR